MELELVLKLLTVLVLVSLITYYITRNYFNVIINMQFRFIDDLKKDCDNLEKTNLELRENYDMTINKIIEDVSRIESKVHHIHNDQKNLTKTSNKNYD